MEWFREIETLLGHGTHPLCQIGCKTHVSKPIKVDLANSNRFVPDYPKLEPLEFTLNVLKPVDPPNVGYCPARGEVSRSIASQGIWEAFDTAVAVEMFKSHKPGVFMDFGANIGWYSVIANRLGRNVIALEADPDLIAAMDEVMISNEYLDYKIVHGWLDHRSPVITPGNTRVRLVKSDLEGLDTEAIRVCDLLLQQNLIDAFMFEWSPMFSDGYLKSIDKVMSYGYDLAVIPDKGYDPSRFAADPLGCTVQIRVEDPELVTEQVTGFFYLQSELE